MDTVWNKRAFPLLVLEAMEDVGWKRSELLGRVDFLVELGSDIASGWRGRSADVLVPRELPTNSLKNLKNCRFRLMVGLGLLSQANSHPSTSWAEKN